jgi:hypothetical protein
MSDTKDNVQDLPWLPAILEISKEYGEGSIEISECLARIATIAKQHNIARGAANSVFNAEIKKYKVRSGQETQTDTLLRLTEQANFFRTSEGIAYANVTVNGSRRIYAVRSTAMRQWLTTRFRDETGKAPSTNALQETINTIDAETCLNGSEVPVFLRVGSTNGKLYLDLANAAGQVVEITANGWRVITDPPVRFRRTKNMRQLPIPQSGGSVEDLKYFINFATKADLILTVAYLVAALRDRGPYPILKLGGEAGAAKTSAARIIRKLIDPNVSPLRSVPKDEHDLFIAAKNSHLIAIDNISTLPAWLSDGLCRLSTGGGYGTRSLYTDDEETTCDAVRPLLLNGIDECVTRGDLADRVINTNLASIDPSKRQTEEELFTAFDAAHPKLLGALLDMAAHGLKMLPTTRPAWLPRMADFAVWATACETKVWPPGTIIALLERKREEVDAAVIEANPALRVLQKLVANRGSWTGMVEGLLKDLTAIAGAAAVAKDWPPNGKSLSGRLRKAATSLRGLGVDVRFGRHIKTGTPVTITRLPDPICVTKTPVASPASPFASPQNESQTEGLCASNERGDAGDAKSPSFLIKINKEEEKIIESVKNIGGNLRHRVTRVAPPWPANNFNGSANSSRDANGDANAIGDANSSAEDWRSYQRGRLAHWQRTRPNEAVEFAWRDLQTRWIWVHRSGHPLGATHDRDAATQELLALGLTPSAGDAR